jgi:tRNA uridine 5-carboxymethylaminomethyl modification enzyme
MKKVEDKRKKRTTLVSYLNKISYPLDVANQLLALKKELPVKQTDKYAKLLARPNLNRADFDVFHSLQQFMKSEEMDDTVFEQAEIEVKYAGYIEKEKRNADKLKRLENIKIPRNFDFERLASLSFEAKEKLNKFKPETLAQASRISGINPSDISVLLVSMGR